MIVEDNLANRDMLKALLELEGAVVSVAADGLAGIDAIVRERPDVALIDIGLPEIDGYEVARRIRATPADHSTRLVALTGYSGEQDRRAALDAGFDAHLVKPLQLAQLDHLLHAFPARSGS